MRSWYSQNCFSEVLNVILIACIELEHYIDSLKQAFPGYSQVVDGIKLDELFTLKINW